MFAMIATKPSPGSGYQEGLSLTVPTSRIALPYKCPTRSRFRVVGSPGDTDGSHRNLTWIKSHTENNSYL